MRSLLLLFVLGVGACAAPTEDVAEGAESAIERSRGTMTDDELRAFREEFQDDYVARHEAARVIADGAQPPCADGKKVLEWVDASIGLGRLEAADTFATNCLRGTQIAERSFAHHLAAARAARFVLDFARAQEHAGTAAGLARGRDARAVAFERAEIAAASNEFDVKAAIDHVLSEGRIGSQTSTALVSNVAGEALEAQTFEITAARERDLLSLVDEWNDPPSAAWLLHYTVTASITREYRYHDALKILASRRGKVVVQQLPAAYLHELGRLVHRALMNHRNDRVGWTQGRHLVKAMAPFQRKDQLLYALALGPYDYVELKEDACKDVYAKGADRTVLENAKKGYLDGTLTPHAALMQVAPLRRPGNALVDVEVFAGTMLEAKGDDLGALDAYWAARQVCPYYGRALSGTYGVMLRRAHAARSRALQPSLPGRPPAAIREYVSNYDRLSDAQKSATAYGLLFWWPYLGTFAQGGRTLYIAPTFQRLVETPPHRPNAAEWARHRGEGDGRLTDDLDGIGGDDIVVAFSRLEDHKGGTIVHEAAHQFHFAAPDSVKACIKRLFDEATERNDFCVGYAATNEYEYFGVGIQHYASPEGFVGYGGITKSWYRDHDPKLLALIDSIAQANGDMARITCPE